MLKKYILLPVILILTLIALTQLASAVRIASKAWLSEYLIEQAWSRTLLGEKKVRPWPWADTWPVAELQVPSLGLSQVVLSGESGAVLAFGPGMREYVDTGLDLEFTMVSGHRDTHFNFLKDIHVDDTFLFKGADGLLRQYKVIDTKVVDENWSLPAVNSAVESLMILATCYPFDQLISGAEKRLLVFAVPFYPLLEQGYKLVRR